MFTLLKVFIAKRILITFILKQINIQASNHGMFAAHKLLSTIQTSDHGMFATHESLKHKCGMIMACLQHINH